MRLFANWMIHFCDSEATVQPASVKLNKGALTFVAQSVGSAFQTLVLAPDPKKKQSCETSRVWKANMCFCN